MKEFVILPGEEGRRLDKFAQNILANAGAGFVYKMLRKKNIVLNDSKATGKELLKAGDNVKFYLSDDTFASFSAPGPKVDDLSALMPPIVYEDDDVLIVNKPSGMLSQKSSASDISLNEICLSYVRRDGLSSDAGFTPSVCNRLDRNTSGLVTFAKTYAAARYLSEGFRDHTFKKYYRCIAKGNVKDAHLEGRIVKDEASNKVRLTDDGSGDIIITNIRNIKYDGRVSLVEVELITGKTHQIRAHLASVGNPIIGDPKYGDPVINKEYKNRYGITSQMLVCCRLVIPDDFDIAKIAGKTFKIPPGDDFSKVM